MTKKDIICSYDGEKGDNCDCGCSMTMTKGILKIDDQKGFFEAMLEIEDRILSIGHFDIYQINNRYGLFIGFNPVTEQIDGEKNINKNLQDTVNTALMHLGLI